MLYSVINVKDKEYKLRLTARASVDLERKLGENPLNMLMQISETNLPSLEKMIYILHAALQAYNHSMSLDDTYALYDDMVDDGMTFEQLIPIIVDIFKVSGFINDKAEKN